MKPNRFLSSKYQLGRRRRSHFPPPTLSHLSPSTFAFIPDAVRFFADVSGNSLLFWALEAVCFFVCRILHFLVLVREKNLLLYVANGERMTNFEGFRCENIFSLASLELGWKFY